MLSFSSLVDVTSLISSVPSDVSVIAYDMEQGMTPAAEFTNIVQSVQQFASVVHGSGRKMSWVPTHTTFDTLQSNGQLAQILPSINIIGYQGKKFLNPD